MRNFSFLLVLFFWISSSFAQTILFTETFDEADNSISGMDNTNGVVWNTLAPGSVASTDYFMVVGGVLEARDPNFPQATWTTGTINTTGYVTVDFEVDISESGALEECADCSGTGAFCIDWVKLEFRIDGGSWFEVLETSCSSTMTNAPGDMILIGNISPPGTLSYSTTISSGIGTSIEFRISCVTWTGTELWMFDNIVVTGNSSLLPVELVSFEASLIENGTVSIDWETVSELNNNFFTIEKSIDAIHWEQLAKIQGAGNSPELLAYEFIDTDVKVGSSYYRLKQTDFDGQTRDHGIRSVQYFNDLADASVFPNPADGRFHVDFGQHYSSMSIRLFNTLGETIATYEVQNARSTELKLEHEMPGIYFIQLSATNKYHKMLRIVNRTNSTVR